MKYFFIFIFFTTNLYSSDLTREDCLEAAQVHGGLNSIDDKCFEVMSTYENFEIKGEVYQINLMNSILWIKQSDEDLRKIAGTKSGLEEVFSVILDEKREVAIVLKNEQQGITIFVHHLSSNGNVAPFIQKSFPHFTESMSYLYDQESSTLMIEHQQKIVSALTFEWSADLVRVGRARVVELNTHTEIP